MLGCLEQRTLRSLFLVARYHMVIGRVLSTVTSSRGRTRVNEEDGDGVDAATLQTYIVHVLKPKDMKFTHPGDREAWHMSFLPTSTLPSGEPRMVFSYDKVISGFAARLTAEEVKAMEKKEGFLSADPDEPMVLLTTYTPKKEGHASKTQKYT